MIKLTEVTNNFQLSGLAPVQKVDPENSLSFVDLLKDKIMEANNLKLEADQLTTDFVLGKTDNIHQIPIATEEARIALSLISAVQNKVVEAYKQVMRMQL
ncbi:MAG: flagellar hook-basal body complex protein FliE [Halanaerobiales bacterium]|nr:flagellar hook-basal body complex protein FliE [Halanaerobiales bacterium]